MAKPRHPPLDAQTIMNYVCKVKGPYEDTLETLRYQGLEQMFGKPINIHEHMKSCNLINHQKTATNAIQGYAHIIEVRDRELRRKES